MTVYVGHVCLFVFSLDSFNPCNRCLYSLFVYTYAYTHIHTVCLDILMMAIHSAVQRTFLSEAGKTVRLNRSLHVLSFTLLIPNFFSIPDTIYADFEQNVVTFRSKTLRRLCKPKCTSEQAMDHSMFTFWIYLVALWVALWAVSRKNISDSLHFYDA